MSWKIRQNKLNRESRFECNHELFRHGPSVTNASEAPRISCNRGKDLKIGSFLLGWGVFEKDWIWEKKFGFWGKICKLDFLRNLGNLFSRDKFCEIAFCGKFCHKKNTFKKSVKKSYTMKIFMHKTLKKILKSNFPSS
jgi:hypothetical protein